MKKIKRDQVFISQIHAEEPASALNCNSSLKYYALMISCPSYLSNFHIKCTWFSSAEGLGFLSSACGHLLFFLLLRFVFLASSIEILTFGLKIQEDSFLLLVPRNTTEWWVLVRMPRVQSQVEILILTVPHQFGFSFNCFKKGGSSLYFIEKAHIYFSMNNKNTFLLLLVVF